MQLLAIVLPLLLGAVAPEEVINCRQETKVGQMVITLAEARRIQAAAERYLINSKLQRPEPVFIDCEGAVRMGAWILEPVDERGELRLAVRTVWNEHLIVRQEMRLRRASGRWKAIGMSEVIYHGRLY